MTMDSYSRFEQAVIAPILEYRRNHDPALLEQSARLLRQLDVDALPTGRTLREYQVEGWMLHQHGIRLRASRLRRANPGYRVSVRRVARRELGRRANLFRPGFIVTATGRDDLPDFAFGVRDRRGVIYELPGSNFEARFAVRALHPAARSADGPIQPLGYIDTVTISPIAVDEDVATWFPAIVHRHPRELLELIDSPAGRHLGPAALRSLSGHRANARWADRAAMVVDGASGTYRSDLLPLGIVRTDSRPDAAPSGATVPELVRTGNGVRWVAGTEPLCQPSTTWLRLSDAIVQDGGTVMVDNTLINYELAADPANDFVAGQWQTVFGARENTEIALVQARPLATDVIPEAILLAGRNDENWFHWIVEYLPRILMVPPGIAQDVPVVVSTRTPRTGLEALRSLTERPVIAIDSDTGQRISTLHVVAPPVQVFDTTKLPWRDGLPMNTAVLRRLREAWQDQEVNDVQRRRIFLQRKSRHRGIENQDVLAGIAARHGLEILDPGSMTFAEQRALFSSAELLVGASGAVMANYLLMREGSILLALTSDQLYDFVLPAALAAVAGVEFHYVTGSSGRALAEFEDRNRWVQADFRVDEPTFEEHLTRALLDLDERHHTS